MTNKLTGTYVFKQDGVEIGRSKNIITTNGTTAILQYLSGNSSDWAGSMAVGCIGNTARVTDLSLTYEIARSAIASKSYRTGTTGYSTNLLILKGRIDPQISGNIYEVGIFPYNTDSVFGIRDKLIITDFSSPSDWATLAGTYTTTSYSAQGAFSPRVGLYNINLVNSSTISNSNFVIDLSSYSSLDTLDALVYVNSTNYGTLNVTLTDVQSVSRTVSFSFDGRVTAGYQVLSSNFPADISSLANISTVTIQASGVYSDITLDSIKVSILGEISNSTALISRSVLTTPIAKIYAIPLDIEYYLELG